jgi:hypothetical protein
MSIVTARPARQYSCSLLLRHDVSHSLSWHGRIRVAQVRPAGGRRFRMRLVKPDVGQLARSIFGGGKPAEEAILLAGRAPALGFTGPDEARRDVRRKNRVEDRKFVASALDRFRGGG